MKRVNYLCFSLWGNKAIFNVGAIRNAALAKEIYGGWRVVIFFDNTVPNETIAALKDLDVKLIDMTDSPIYGLFWRFLAIDFPDADYVIFRDTDSRLSEREKFAVDEWIREDSILHIMRDHPCHDIPFGADSLSILGGMWGIKGNAVKMQSEIEEFIKNNENQYGVDQKFLMSIFKKFKDSKTVHDEFFDKKPFPIRRNGFRFVGERIDENEQPVGDDWLQIKIYNKEHHPSLSRRIKKYMKRFF